MSTPEPIEPMANNFKVQNTSPSIVLGVKRKVEGGLTRRNKGCVICWCFSDVLNGSLEGERKENGAIQKKQALDGEQMRMQPDCADLLVFVSYSRTVAVWVEESQTAL